MIGLALRVTVLMVTTLLLVSMTLLGAFYLQRASDTGRTPLAPLPGRLAAIVELLEADPANSDRILRAATSPDFRLSLRPGPLGAQDHDEHPRVAALLQRGAATLRAHALSVSGQRAGDEDGDGSGALRVAVALQDGRVLEAEVRGATLRRTLGRPFALATILLVGAIGLAALWALRAQIRPLEALARAVERIGTNADGTPLPESGAREVRQLVDAFNRMRERIHRLLEARTRLLAAISHDLGTYLTRLRLRVELIDDPEQRTRAGQDLHDMHQLLRDALALARTEAAGDAPPEAVDLVALAERERRERHAEGGQVSLQAPATLVVSGQALGLARVLSNLVGNALKYAGAAEIHLARDGAQAELRVDDHGPGIPAAEREAVLEPFYRRDHARTLDGGGSGLGLAIVADIVRQHHGEFRLEETPGGGLRARVRLPLANART
ncbi:ATP-binding protein [Solimonas variicoloris]|uniref:ATP-binding protein n=1 Tax=Solimonas variicoloris TaxID=254408 RepID=UPI0003817A71|nr:ATP-binding protein [Solimonas variicoloris]